MNNLNDILNRYFEGETSAEEERQLRAFFTSEDVPPEWIAYRPLFAYFKAENEKAGKRNADDEDALYAEDLFDGIPTPEALLREETTTRELFGREEADAGFSGKSFELKAREAMSDAASGEASGKHRTPGPNRRRLWYAIAGMAASVLLIAGIYRLLNPVDPCFCSENYVVINGRCYTDIHQVRTLAWEALQEVATPTEDYFPAPDEVFNDREIINEQLQELSTLFDE